MEFMRLFASIFFGCILAVTCGIGTGGLLYVSFLISKVNKAHFLTSQLEENGPILAIIVGVFFLVISTSYFYFSRLNLYDLFFLGGLKDFI